MSGSTVQTIISLLDCLVSSTADLWPLYEQGLIDHVTTLFVSGATLIHQNDDERNLSEVILPLLDTVHGIMKYSSKVSICQVLTQEFIVLRNDCIYSIVMDYSHHIVKRNVL